MYKIIIKTTFLSLLLALKVIICSYTCPCSSSSSACPQTYRFPDSGVVPNCNGNVSFTSNYLYDGWIYQFSVNSDQFCESFQIDASQNASKAGCDYIVSKWVPGSPCNFSLTVKSPCGYYAPGVRNVFNYSGVSSNGSCNGPSFYSNSQSSAGQTGC